HGIITTILDPLLLRPGHSCRKSAVPWPAIAGQHLDSRACARCGPLLLIPNLTHLFASARAGNKALSHSRLETALRLSQHHGAGPQTSVVLGRARACFRNSACAAPNPRPLSGPSAHVSCKMRLSCFA